MTVLAADVSPELALLLDDRTGWPGTIRTLDDADEEICTTVACRIVLYEDDGRQQVTATDIEGPARCFRRGTAVAGAIVSESGIELGRCEFRISLAPGDSICYHPAAGHG